MASVKDLAKIFEEKESLPRSVVELRRISRALDQRNGKYNRETDAGGQKESRTLAQDGQMGYVEPQEGLLDDAYSLEKIHEREEVQEIQEIVEDHEDEETIEIDESEISHDGDMTEYNTTDSAISGKHDEQSVANDGKFTDAASNSIIRTSVEAGQFALTDAEIDAGTAFLNIEKPIVKHFGKGVNAYCFVKQNSGLLKAVLLYFHPETGRLYIVREKQGQLHSLYLHLGFFAKIDCAPDALYYLVKNSEDEKLRNYVSELSKMPHLVVWTSDSFRRTSRKPRFLRRLQTMNIRSKRSLVFIFTKLEERDAVCRLIESAAAAHGLDTIDMAIAPDWSL